MSTNENLETRINDVEAIVNTGGTKIKTDYNRTNYEISKGSKEAKYAYILTAGDYGYTVKVEEGQAGEYKLPSLIIHLDECLNILEITGLGKPIAQQTVYDIIDNMLEEHAARQIHG